MPKTQHARMLKSFGEVLPLIEDTGEKEIVASRNPKIVNFREKQFPRFLAAKSNLER